MICCKRFFTHILHVAREIYAFFGRVAAKWIRALCPETFCAWIAAIRKVLGFCASALFMGRLWCNSFRWWRVYHWYCCKDHHHHRIIFIPARDLSKSIFRSHFLMFYNFNILICFVPIWPWILSPFHSPKVLVNNIIATAGLIEVFLLKHCDRFFGDHQPPSPPWNDQWPFAEELLFAILLLINKVNTITRRLISRRRPCWNGQNPTWPGWDEVIRIFFYW